MFFHFHLKFTISNCGPYILQKKTCNSSCTIFIDDRACSSPLCKDGKELKDRCDSVFTCRHLDLVKEGPACQPQSPIRCEDIR